jgi:hypothetical protein
MNRTTTLALAGLASAALALPADAQFVYGTADRADPLTLIDLSSVRETDQFPLPVNIADDVSGLLGTQGLTIYAMTADKQNGRLLILDQSPLAAGLDPTSNLYSYDYTTRNLVFEGRLTTPGGVDLGFAGLALTNKGDFYGILNIGGVPGKGLYEIDLANPVGSGFGKRFSSELVVPTATQPGGDGAFDFGTLDYDPVTDQILAVVDDNAAPQGRGLYSIDPDAGTFNFVAPSPTDRRAFEQFEGLAAGNGFAYLMTDEPGFIYSYDLVNGGPYQDFLSPIVDGSQLFAGAAFAPELLPTPALRGDANGDGVVNLADFGILRANFGTRGPFLGIAQADFTGDATVNLADFGVLRANFGNVTPTVVASFDAWLATIPEPASMTFLGVGLLALRRRVRA